MVFDNVKKGDRFRSNVGLILTVTEVTDRGFKYDCTPHHIYPARMGPSVVKSGELFYKDHNYIDWDLSYVKELPNERYWIK